MVLATWWGWCVAPSIALAVALAFFFGYLLTFSAYAAPGSMSPRPSGPRSPPTPSRSW